MKKQAKKLKLAKETVAALLPQVAGGITALCNTVRNCPTGPQACPQSGKYPC
jgi:hypothetical protein